MGIIWNAGLGQQTLAVQSAFRSVMGRSSPPRQRRKKKATGPRRKARGSKVKRVARKAAKLVKGSAAAKRYMASIRRKRRA